MLNKYNILKFTFFETRETKTFFWRHKKKIDVRVCVFALVATHTRTAQNIRTILNGHRIRFQILKVVLHLLAYNTKMAKHVYLKVKPHKL